MNVQNAFIKLNVPSLKNSPATLAIGMDMAVNQRDIPHSSLTATVQHLFDDAGTLAISSLRFNLDADLPGIQAAFSGNMAESGITGESHIRLAPLFDTISLLIPENTEKPTIAGDIFLSAGVSMEPNEPLRFDARLDAANLGLSGGPIGGKSLEAGSLGLHVNGTFDQKNQTLRLDNGEIEFLDNSRMQLSGRIEQAGSGSPFADLTIAPLFLDLDETVHFFKAFIPEQLVFGDSENESFLSLTRAGFSGSLIDGPAQIQVSDLALGLGRILFFTDKTRASSLALEGARLQIQDLQTGLSAGFPESALIGASFEIDRFVSQNGKESLSVSGLHLDRLIAEAREIKKAEHSPFAVQADITLSDSLSIKKIRIPGQLDIRGLDQSLSARASLHSDGSAFGTLENLDLTLPLSLRDNRSSGPLDTVCRVSITLPGFTLSGINPPHIDINGLAARITMDDLLLAHLEAGMADSGRSGFTLDAKMTADLLRLFEHHLQEQLPGISAAGNASLTLHTKGRIPDAQKIDQLKSLRIAGNLDFLEDLRIEAQLKDGGLNLARKDAPPIHIPSISGEPLLRYRLSGKSGQGRLDARLRVNGIKDIPGLQINEPLSVDLSLDADHRFLKVFALHQSLSVEPLDIYQNIQISVDGLDAILSKKPLPDPLSWVSSIEMAASVGIEIPDCAKIRSAVPSAVTNMDIEGAVSALARLQLTPGQEVNGGLRLVLNGISVDMPNIMTLQKINGDIDLSKKYSIMTQTADETRQASSLLSQQVIQPAVAGSAFGSLENRNLHRHLSLLTERIRSSPDLSMKTARFQSLPFPLVIDSSRVMINQQEGIPNLDYFQAELLGGTINGFLSLRKRESGFFVESEINLTGINTGLIFPEAVSGIPDSEAEISGFLYADIPVRDRLKPLLDDTTVTVEFTRIGSKALERILFALDPHESNEAIVSQRRLLKAGTPRRVRLEIKDGFLSLSGEVSVKSITLPLPALRRLNIASMPGIEKFESGLSALTPVISILNDLSARRMTIKKDNGGVRFY
jgi:translocation and assembly module TamB